jgi:hypothetical protein
LTYSITIGSILNDYQLPGQADPGFRERQNGQGVFQFRAQRSYQAGSGDVDQGFGGFAGQLLRGVEGRSARPVCIRINDRWRICFEWPNGSPGPQNLEIVDYH